MAKQPPPLDEKKLKISTERIERAWENLRKHVLMGPLVTRARLKVIDYQPQVPAMFSIVSSSGEVFANPFNYPRTVDEWTFALAHSLLHLAFGHFRQIKRGILWNIACDCVINEFLNRMRIGTQPEGLLRLPGGMPNDEDKLFTMWTQNKMPPKGETTNGSAADMLAGAPSKANWADIFARAIRRAAKLSLSAAAGDDTELGQAQQARSWFVKNYPLLGSVLQHFRLVEDAKLCERLGIRIAAVNPGRRQMILNPGWAMEDGEYRYVMAHMALHAGLQHVYRRKWRDPFIWNAACDYCINAWLADLPYLKRMCKPPNEGLLLSVEHRNKSPELIYDDLARNEKATRKLITFAGEGVSDCHGGDAAAGDDEAAPQKDRLLLDALLRGHQIHTESGKDRLPYTLIDEMRALEHPPLPWDVQLGRWFDENIPPIERIRTYAQPSRRQSATPEIARPRYVWPDEETAQRGTFGLIIAETVQLPKPMLGLVMGAISAYVLGRNIPSVRLIRSGAEVTDIGMVSAEELTQHAVKAIQTSQKTSIIQPAIELLAQARDFPEDAPILIVTAMPCDRVKTHRTHAYVVPEGGRLQFESRAPLIEVSGD